MSKINSIDWSSIELYHGTNDKFLDSILDKGFFIPTHNGNWLGRGTYFAVGSIFLPILYSKLHANNHGGYPCIIKINAEYLSNDIKEKILDLTSQEGLNLFHNISNDFINFIEPYNNDYPELFKQLTLLEKHYNSSPFYYDKLKPNLTPNLEWLVTAYSSQYPHTEKDNNIDPRIDSLNQMSSENITNKIFDWFNYKYSCGFEKDVPIRGVMANFNSGQGTPIALAKVLKNKKIKRSFTDYISYLNRTELSIFGYDYYRTEERFWDFNKLFETSPTKGKHFETFRGKGQIVALLRNSFDRSSKKIDFKMDRKSIDDLYNLITSEHDTN